MTMAERHDALDIGRVVQRTFQVLGRNAVPFLAMSIVLVGAPTLLMGLINLTQPKTTSFSAASVVGGVAVAIFNVFISVLLQTCIVIAAVADLKGSKPSIMETAQRALVFVLPVVAISILAALGIVFGTMLLIVPGLMLATMWAVVVPAAVIEKSGVFGAFRRSRELTRGNRWRIFALYAVFIIITAVLQFSLLRLAGFSMTGAGAGAAVVASVPILIVSTAIGVVVTLVSAVGVACLYFELRAAGDGLDLDDLASVFA